MRSVRREVWLSWPADPRRLASRLMVVELFSVWPGLGWLVSARVGPWRRRRWCWRACHARVMFAAAVAEAARFSKFLGRHEHRSAVPARSDRKVCGMHEQKREDVVVRPDPQAQRAAGQSLGPGDVVTFNDRADVEPVSVFDQVRGSR